MERSDNVLFPRPTDSTQVAVIVESAMEVQLLVVEDLVSVIFELWECSKLTDTQAEQCLLAVEQGLEELERLLCEDGLSG